MANQQIDQKYASMRGRHGTAHASANGYVGHWFFTREQRFLLSKIKPGLTLDIACGSGLMLLDAPDLDVIGIDYNATACIQAHSNSVAITRSDAFNLPFYNDTFHSVVNCQFLNQQTDNDAQRFLSEAARVLSPGGKLHLVWRGADTLIHRTVYGLSSLLRKLVGEPIFPQFDHQPNALIESSKTFNLKVVEQSMTLPFGPKEVSPGSLTAKIAGASRYLCLEKEK